MKRDDLATAEPTSAIDAYGSVEFLRRLEALLPIAKMRNGTNTAAAVYAALMAELLATARPVTDLEALSDKQLRQTCRNLARALNNGGKASFDLPFGTTAVSPEPGTLTIGRQEFVLDVGHAGLHPLEAVRHDAHGPNLERLVTLIATKTKDLACHRLGVPTPKHIVDNDSRHVLQFAPLAEAGGVILQRPSSDTGADRFCAALPWQIDHLADSMVAQMESLWGRRVEIGARVEKLRRAAEAGILAEAVLEGQASVEAISIQELRADESISLYVEYRAIDEALRSGTVIDYIPAFRKLDGPLPPPPSISARVGIPERLAQVGATGWIDGLAEAVALAAPQGCAAVLATLGEEYETTVVFPTRSGALCAELYWREGLITVSTSLPGSFVWSADKLELTGVVLPEAMVQALAGRSLSDIVELPFGAGLEILDATIVPDGLVLTLDLGEKLVNCEQGTILDSPSLDRHLLRYGVKGSDWK